MSPINKPWATRVQLRGVAELTRSWWSPVWQPELQQRPYERAAVARSASDLVLAVPKSAAEVPVWTVDAGICAHQPGGVALLCLAGGTVCIPDAGTTDRLIPTNWLGEIGRLAGHPFTLRQCRCRELMVTGRLASSVSASNRKRPVPRVGQGRRASWCDACLCLRRRIVWERFVMGEGHRRRLARSEPRHGYVSFVRYAGRGLLTSADCQALLRGLRRHPIQSDRRPAVSASMPALAFRSSFRRLSILYCRSQRDRVLELLSSLAELAAGLALLHRAFDRRRGVGSFRNFPSISWKRA